MPTSYVQFLIRNLTPLELPNKTVDVVVVISLVVPLVLSAVFLIRDVRKKRRT